MADQLVTLTLGRVFRTFRADVERLQDDLLQEGAIILRREEEASIRLRWYDTGATLGSLQEEIVVEGSKKSYRLFPIATNKGAPYPTFGEYGTGRAGAVSGGPAPRGYRYGQSAGMRARRYSRIAVMLSRPQIEKLSRETIANFAKQY